MRVHTETQQWEAGRLISFADEEPVALNRVEGRLNELWRQASAHCQADDGAPLTRASLWNLVAYHPHPPEASPARGDVAELKHRLRAVTAQVPARVLHLDQWAAQHAPAPETHVEAHVASHCLQLPPGRNLVCAEEVHLYGYGDAGRQHFPALVRALRAPDLPLALLWLQDMPRRGRMLGQLLGLSDRVLIDTQHSPEPETLLAVQELLRATDVTVADLGWLRLAPLRALVARFFDPPGRAEQLQQLTRVEVEVNPTGRNAGLLLLGWLLSRTGYGDIAYNDGDARDDVAAWHARRDGRTAAASLHVREGDGGLDGVFAVTIEAGGDTFRVHDVDPQHMEQRGPDHEQPRIRMRTKDDAGLIAEALGGTVTGLAVYRQALAAATALAEAEQWNR